MKENHPSEFTALQNSKNDGHPMSLGSQPNLSQYPPQQSMPPLPNYEGRTNAPPKAPDTCTLPRRSIVREDISTKYRSPSSDRQPPPYSRHQPPEPFNNYRKPPPPPRIVDNSTVPAPRIVNPNLKPYQHIPQNSLSFQQEARKRQEQTAKENTCQNNTYFRRGTNEFYGPRPINIFQDQNSRFTNGTIEDHTNLPSKSTEDLLNASRVTKDMSENSNNYHNTSQKTNPQPYLHNHSMGNNIQEILSSDSVYPSSEKPTKINGYETVFEANSRSSPLNDRHNHHERENPRTETLVQRVNSEMVTFRSPIKESPIVRRRDEYHSRHQAVPNGCNDTNKFPHFQMTSSKENSSNDYRQLEVSKDNQERNAKSNQESRNNELFIYEEEVNEKRNIKRIQKNVHNKTNYDQSCQIGENSNYEEKHSIVIRSTDDTRKPYDGADCLTVKDVQTYQPKTTKEIFNEKDQHENGRKGDGCAASTGETSTSSSWMEWTQQLQAYVAWVNSQLRKKPGRPLVSDLRKDFQNGLVFADLIEIIAGERVSGLIRDSDTPQIRKENLDRILQFMSAKRIRMTHITSKEIAEGNLKSIMRVILALAAHYKPQSVREGSQQHGNSSVHTQEEDKAETRNKTVMHDVGVGPDTPDTPLKADKTPSLTRRNLTSLDGSEEVHETIPLKRQPSLTQTPRPTSPVYENLMPKRSGTNRWAYDSLRASHKFYWGSSSVGKHQRKNYSKDDSSDDGMNSTLNTSRCTSLNNSMDGDNDIFNYEDVSNENSGNVKNKPAALSFWQELQEHRGEKPKVSNVCEAEQNPFRYHTIHRMSGRRKLPQIPGYSSPSSNNSRGTTPIGINSGPPSDISHGIQEESLERRVNDSSGIKCPEGRGGTGNDSIDEASREPEGRSQNSSPATSLVRGHVVESWRQVLGFEDELKGALKDVQKSRNESMDCREGSKHENEDNSTLRQEVIRHVLARQALENEKTELTLHIHQKDNIIADLRKQLLQKEKNLHVQRAQFDEVIKNIQNGKSYRTSRVESPIGRNQSREELQLVREAIGSLRNNFRDTDPNQHTLDTLEQAISILMERGMMINNICSENQNGTLSRKDKKNQNGYSTESQTKFIYFTDRTVTPFMSSINKRLGEVTLKDFKNAFDRAGNFRFHFKSHDPEYGLVKEEIANDEAVLPGIDGKIIAWVEEDLE